MSSNQDPSGLRDLRLDLDTRFPSFSRQDSPNFQYFHRCLRVRNPYAVYLESIQLAFRHGQLELASQQLEEIKYDYPNAQLLFLLLGYCTGDSDAITYIELLDAYDCSDLEKIGGEIVSHITALVPSGRLTFWDTFFCPDAPKVYCVHSRAKRCIDFIFYRLGQEISGSSSYY